MKRREFLKGAGSAALLGSMLNTRSYADEPARLASRRVWCWAGTDQWMNGFLQTHGGEVMPESLPCPPVEWVDFFHCRNVNYQPVDLNYHTDEDRYTAERLKVLQKYDEVSVHLGRRSDLKLVTGLSQTSLECPNLVGGFYDDFSSAVQKNLITVQSVEELAWALKSANPYLKLNAVCYTMHLSVDLSPYLSYFDSVTLWTWHAADLQDLDAHVAQANRLYRKPLHLGLYLIPYGDLHVDKNDPHYWARTMNTVTMPMETLKFQCDRARRYLKDGQIEAIHILGSYARGELKTEQARWLADFCLSV